MERMAFILAEAPEDIKPVLVKIKMDQDKDTNMKALGCSTTELLTKTLAYLMKCEVTDEKITRLVMKGKKMMIIRNLWNLMPEQCTTCLKDYHHPLGEEPMVRCRRCSKGACSECYPEKVLRWHYLCSTCDLVVGEQLALPEDALTAKEKDKSKKKMTQPSQDGVLSQNQFASLSEENDDDDEEDARTEEIEKKRKNENGGTSKNKENKDDDSKDDKNDKSEKPICTGFKFGGKCPHGMSGRKAHGKWEQCNRSHPKVCSKLLAHGTRGKQGCSGRDCDKYHPRMCYSSMASKECSRERCSYWHCKGTTFTLTSTTYSSSTTQTRGGRPGPREVRSQESRDSREAAPSRRREDKEREMRRDGGALVEEERRSQDTAAAFLDIGQLIRQEVQKAFLAMLPAVGSGSGAIPTPTTTPASRPTMGPGMLSYAEAVEALRSASR